MSTLNRAFVAAIATALILPLAATAADEKPAEQTQKSAPAPKKVPPHSHSEANKQGAPAAAPDQPAPAKKEQGHKHSDWK